MSRRVVLIAAALTLLAGIAWGVWRAELEGSNRTRGPEVEPRAEAIDPSGPVAGPEGEPLRGHSLARKPGTPSTEGKSSPQRGAVSQQLEAIDAPRPSTQVVAARRALRDPSPEVRRSAVRELVRHEDRAAVRALRRLARRDPNPEVRAAAEEGLRELGAEDAIAKMNERRDRSEDPAETEETPRRSQPGPGAQDYDSMSMESLVALLSSPDLDEREAAIDALAYNEHYGAIRDLYQAFFFREPDWDVRDLILDALEELDQEVEEVRELNYLTEEVEIDLAEIGKTLGFSPPDN